MNEEKFNESIDKIDVPLDKLIERETIAIHEAKKSKKVRKATKRSFLIACSLCVGLLGAGFFSSNMAEALSNMPIIGTIYESFGDMAADDIEQNHLATMIEKHDQNETLTMTVREATYDGGRLLITVTYSGNNDLSLQEGHVGYHKITINGKPINSTMGTTSQEQINSNTIVELHEYTLTNYNEYGDKIEVALHGHNLFGTKGHMNVTFPIEKIDKEIVEIIPDTKVQDGPYTIEANKVVFSPLSTRIDLSIDYPEEMDVNDTWPWFDFYAIDNEGNRFDGIKIQSGMANNHGHHMIVRLPPIDSIPTSLTLIPRDVDNEGRRYDLSALKLKIPLHQNE